MKMNDIDKRIVNYLERANAILNHCRDDLVIERSRNADEPSDDTELRLEIVKLIQEEEHWQHALEGGLNG